MPDLRGNRPALTGIEFRPAGRGDAETVAWLHASSWRATYRGILSDEFLDGPAVDNRIEAWRARLAPVTPDEISRAEKQLVVLAEEDGTPCGFVCAFLDGDPRWGAFLDNLHVLPAWQGRGLGQELMARAGAWVAGKRSGSGLYLLVYERNRAAQEFYDHLGGQRVERFPHGAVDGSDQIMVRYWWPRPTLGRPPASGG